MFTIVRDDLSVINRPEPIDLPLFEDLLLSLPEVATRLGPPPRDRQIVGVDLDNCRDPETGQPDEWAKDVIETLDSYTEVSPSGTGYHVLLTGELPGNRNRTDDIELYETCRFFTVTADHVDGTPESMQDRQTAHDAVYRKHVAPDNDEPTQSSGSDGPSTESGLDDGRLLQRAENAANGEKFRRLWAWLDERLREPLGGGHGSVFDAGVLDRR